jgi:hypothetical protein
MHKAFKIGIDHGTLKVGMLVLNHDDLTWNCPKLGIMEKKITFL